MVSQSGKWAIALAFLSASVPLAAQTHKTTRRAWNGPEITTESIADLTDAQLGSRIAAADNPVMTKPCEVATPVLGELVRRHPTDTRFVHLNEIAQMFCADERRDYAAAERHYSAIEVLPEYAGLVVVGLYLASQNKDAERVLGRLERLRSLEDGDIFAALDAQQFWAGMRTIIGAGRKEELGRFALGVARSPLLVRIKDRDLRSSIASLAIVPAHQAGFDYLIPNLLNIVTSPTAYRDMLGDRRYQAVWPFIESAAGEGMSRVVEAHLSVMRSLPPKERADRDERGELVDALLFAGKFDEAAAMGASVLAEFARDDVSWSIDRAWTVNGAAYALDALGRREEADSYFDRLAGIDSDTFTWVVNFTTNRASRLVGQGRWSEALAASDLARKVAQSQGSTYAQMLVAHTRVCALYGLGRGPEAEADLAFTAQNRVTSIELAAGAQRCAGHDDAAAQMLVDALADEATRSSAISSLQNPKFEFYPPAEKLPGLDELLPRYPALAAAFAREARAIPDGFTPAVAALRKRP